MNKSIQLAIVGHANVGKTSLVRTLARDSHFGQVSNKPGTTRHTEGIRFKIDQDVLIECYDTPGLEDSLALFDYLESLTAPNARLDAVARIDLFLVGPEATGRFEQEAKVLRQLLKSDAGLYVIDTREPVLPKYRDELDILSHCGKPLLPILNFTDHAESHEADWRDALSRIGLHVLVRFDTVSPPLEGEKRLYESLMLLVESSAPQLTRWLAELDKKRQLRRESAYQIIAETLVDVTAASRWVEQGDDVDAEKNKLQNAVREREARAIDDLLKLYQFDQNSAQQGDLPLLEGRFDSDLFHKETLKQMGIHVSKGVVTGAVTGAGIDLAVGGLTLGSAATVGAILGGLSQSVRHYGRKISNKLSGKEKLSVDNAVICLLSLRLQALQQRLDLRGHAAQDRVQLSLPQEALWKKGQLPECLSTARAHYEWSSLNKSLRFSDQKRKLAILELSKILQQPKEHK